MIHFVLPIPGEEMDTTILLLPFETRMITQLKGRVKDSTVLLPGADPGIFERRGRKVGCPVGCRWWSLPGHAPPENVEFWIVRNTISSILREFDAILLLF